MLMFTGIIQQVGTVASLETVPTGTRLAVDPVGWSMEAAPGDSVAVSGCCLTVSELAVGLLCFDVIQQTLSVTTLGSLAVGARVNLEPPVTAASLLSGHVVQGHVDGVGVVSRADTQAERRLRIEPPAALMATIVIANALSRGRTSGAIVYTLGKWLGTW